MSVVVRFAPSPTGFLHVGNICTALYNALFARKHGGRFILRLDDTDEARVEARYADGIVEDLRWLGLSYEELVRQSTRGELYEEAVARLKETGRLYACTETPEELALRARLLRQQGKPPVYRQGDGRVEKGHPPHWRFALSGRKIVFKDLVRGSVGVETKSVSDPVLVRSDGSFLYTLPSVVDDMALGITHVIRGEDHTTNTAIHLELIEALGGDVPCFAHHPLVVDSKGRNLSKRVGDVGVQRWREEGFESIAVMSWLAREEALSLEDLAQQFELSSLGSSPIRFDPKALAARNARVLRSLEYEQVRRRLEEMHVGGGERFWTTVRANVSVLREVQEWWEILRGDLRGRAVVEDEGLLQEALKQLPQEPWGEHTWKEWTRTVAAQTNKHGKLQGGKPRSSKLQGGKPRSSKLLFLCLRRALTGRDTGPEMGVLLPLMGRERVAFLLKTALRHRR